MINDDFALHHVKKFTNFLRKAPGIKKDEAATHKRPKLEAVHDEVV